MQLARAVRNRTTGVLYVLDEPSSGLHPSNIVGLNAVMHDLIADGNSVLLVDHDTQILKESDWIIEMGPEAGAGGPIALVRDGDEISIDVYKKELTLHVSDEELERRRAEWHYTPKPVKGFMARYRKLAASANRGGILVVDD